MTNYEEQINALLEAADSSSPLLKAAFIQAIREVQLNLFNSALVEEALANGDITSALSGSGMAALEDLLFGIGMDNDAYIFNKSANDIFILGAAVSIKTLAPDIQKAISFDSIGERAIAFLRADNLRMVEDLSASSLAGVRVAIERSLATGTNPAKMAADIRQLIGLTGPQMQAVLNFRAQLESGSQLNFTPAGERRLSAIDRMLVNRQMKYGTLTPVQIDTLVENYYQSLLNKRALDIAHTEALNAINNGRQEMWNQGFDQGLFDDNVDRKFWIVTPDDRLRATHAAIPNMNPYGVKLRSPFITPFGTVMGPGDRNVNLINCRCIAILGWYGQVYTGDGGLTD